MDLAGDLSENGLASDVTGQMHDGKGRQEDEQPSLEAPRPLSRTEDQQNNPTKLWMDMQKESRFNSYKDYIQKHREKGPQYHHILDLFDAQERDFKALARHNSEWKSDPGKCSLFDFDSSQNMRE